MSAVSRARILENLQADILRLQGFKAVGNPLLDIGLGPIKKAFPNASFPLAAVHEFVCVKTEDAASTGGFIAGLLSSLTRAGGAIIWISSSRTLFPPALKNFNLEPERFIFIDLRKGKDVAWAMEEALKCEAVSAVVGEMRDIDFTTSRRLQLAVEKSSVTGFVIRADNRKLVTTACVSRWKITSLPGVPIATNKSDFMPGIGFSKWRVELLRIRNGKPGVWDVVWRDGQFMVDDIVSTSEEKLRDASTYEASQTRSVERKTG